MNKINTKKMLFFIINITILIIAFFFLGSELLFRDKDLYNYFNSLFMLYAVINLFLYVYSNKLIIVNLILLIICTIWISIFLNTPIV